MNIAVLLSGGVDSSVAAALLKEQGHTLTAFYLKIWLEDDLSSLGDCPWEEDLTYVRAVCEKLQIPLRIINLQKEYWAHVVSYVIEQIKAGNTPNPDIFCNKLIKFGAFLDYIGDEFDYVATGHYARVHTHQGRTHMYRAPDAIKDQTYFLSYLSLPQLQKALFPVGHLTKHQVRELAYAYDLPTKNRKDSQGICFLGKIKFNEFIKHHVGIKPGALIEFETGKKLGTHQGFFYFTIGQRQGSGLAGGPWYVVKKDHVKNEVFVSRNYHSEDKARDTFIIGNCNWFDDAMLKDDSPQLQVKMRHGPKLYTCTLHKKGEDTYDVVLNERDQGIAPGQFAVFYDGERCVGSGLILS